MLRMNVVAASLLISASAALAQQQTPAPQPAKADPKAITVIYSEQEAAVMLRMLDLAVRQAGLDVAGNAAVLANKIKDAAKAAGIVQAPPKTTNP